MFTQQRFSVRRLQAPDVHAVLKVISECRREFGLEGRVPEILEPSDRHLFETYQSRRSADFVAVRDGVVVGGAGIARLADSDSSICELQRMYLRPADRGVGMGRALMTQCLEAARQFAYQHCYAETVSQMTTALAFYERCGFRRLKGPVEGTGHHHNDCWLLLPLYETQVGVVGI